jgi:hypothetical protein
MTSHVGIIVLVRTALKNRSNVVVYPYIIIACYLDGLLLCHSGTYILPSGSSVPVAVTISSQSSVVVVSAFILNSSIISNESVSYMQYSLYISNLSSKCDSFFFNRTAVHGCVVVFAVSGFPHGCFCQELDKCDKTYEIRSTRCDAGITPSPHTEHTHKSPK